MPVQFKENTVTTIAMLLFLIIAVLAAVPTAEALTDRERLQKLAQQNGIVRGDVLTDPLKTAKVVCICHDQNLDGRLGFLRYSLQNQQQHIVVSCLVPVFTVAGDVTGSSACDAYSVVAR